MDVILARHGETEWSKSGQHTGLTDIPLTENGVIQGKNLGKRLNKKPFALVLCSPLKRAQETCKLSGYFDQAEITEDLYEWDYGEFEGITTKEIRKTHPGWTVFKGPITGGETIEQVSARADRVT